MVWFVWGGRGGGGLKASLLRWHGDVMHSKVYNRYGMQK